MVNVAQTQLAPLSRMFSATVLRELGRHGRSPLLANLVAQSRIQSLLEPHATVGDAFERAFAALRILGNRDEYVYRTAITQKILLGHHNLRTATMLGEARVGMNKADVVVFNGTSTAYEIKSERDSLVRLRAQVASYSTVFAGVNVVTSPHHVAHVLRLVPEEVGVKVLSRRYTLQTERPAHVDSSRTDPVAVLDFVRVNEASKILRALNIDVPRVPNTQLRSRLRDIFRNLEPALVHDQMVSVLKETRSQRDTSKLIGEIPASLRAAMLTLKMDDASEKRIRDVTLLPIGAVFAWR